MDVPQSKKKMGTGTKVILGCLGCGVLVAGGFFILFVVGIAAATSGARKAVNPNQSGTPSTSSVESNGASKEKVEEIPSITANELKSIYHANEVAADEQFKGKTYVIGGHVSQISKDAFGGIWVGLETNQMFADVHCSIPRDLESEAAALRKGQAIAVRGQIKGMVLMSVMVDAESIQVIKKK